MTGTRLADVHGRAIVDHPMPDYYWIVNCACRQDGPWTVLGPAGDKFACARCGKYMRIEAIVDPHQPDGTGA